MKNTYIEVTRIDDCFVGRDCSQVTLDYRFSMMLLSEDGIMFYDNIEDDSFYENRYLYDEKRKDFPYYEASCYKGVCKTYVNQILKVGKTYISISDYGKIKQHIVIDCNGEALLVTYNLGRLINRDSTYNVPFDRGELNSLLGTICDDGKLLLVRNNGTFLDISKILNETSSKDMDFDNRIGSIIKKEINDNSMFDRDLILVKLGGNGLEMIGLRNLRMIEPGNYYVSYYKVPLENIHNIEDIRIKDMRVPYILSILNPDIGHKYLKGERKKVRARKKKRDS